MEVREISKLTVEPYEFGAKLGLDFSGAKAHALFLAGLFAVVTLGIGLPLTREATLFVLEENNLVEMLTFIVFLAGGALGLKVFYRSLKSGESFLFTRFYFIFSAALIFIGMEEISWGQQLLGFDTPESFRRINEQGETTLHNIKGMSGNSEYLRLLFGIGGAIGVSLRAYEPLRKLAAPKFLLPWFLIIAGHSVVDIFNDIVPIERHFDALISELAELVELLIALAALFYIFGNLRNSYGGKSLPGENKF